MKPKTFLLAIGLCAAFLAAPLASQIESDFNLDGWDELVIGVPQDGAFELGGFVFPGPGAINLVYGGPIGLTVVGNQLYTQADFGEFNENGDQFGQTVTMGDYDGNGFTDVAIGIPSETLAVANQGAVIVVLNNAVGFGGAGTRFLFNMGIFCPAPQPSDHFGAALTSADFNNDGFDDLAIGIPNNTPSADEAGVVLVRYGDPSGFLTLGGQNECWSQDTPGVADAAERFDHFGSALCAGDFNGDGFPDLGIGVPGEDLGLTVDAGAVNVLYGSPAGLTASLEFLTGASCEGAETGDQFGFALRAGDFDGDNVDDLACGIPYEDIGAIVDAGAVEINYGILFGGFQPGVCFHLDSPGLPSMTEDNDQFGYDLAEGNFDGNFPTDLAIGIPRKDVNAFIDAGAALVLWGEAGTGLVADGNQALVDCDLEAFAYFGLALTSGDFGAPFLSGGADDLAIGAPYRDVSGELNPGSIQIRYGRTGLNGQLGIGYCGDQDTPGLAGVAALYEFFARGLGK